MSLKVGSRLRTPSSTVEVIVIKSGEDDGELTCAGAPMVATPTTGTPVTGGVMVQLGKRYGEDVSGVEVLCTKPGAGPLEYDGRPLTVRAAASLPASD
ncbi:MAG TPA: hypothetical protein VI248_18250 [Kineosporiaceae bacterium]